MEGLFRENSFRCDQVGQIWFPARCERKFKNSSLDQVENSPLISFLRYACFFQEGICNCFPSKVRQKLYPGGKVIEGVSLKVARAMK
jgi:hypothetical protein